MAATVNDGVYCDSEVNHEFIPPSQRNDAPLAGIIPSELDEIDPKKFFPDFEQGGKLRFSRIFANAKPTMKEQIWFTSRTFNKKRRAETAKQKQSAEEEELAAIESLKQSKIAHSADKPGTSTEGGGRMFGENEVEGKDDSPPSGWDFRLGDLPKKEDCCTDEYELLCAENLEELLSEKRQQQSNEEDDESAPPWRFGPAQIWYDRMGVPANPSNFDYGMKKRSANLKTAAESMPSLEDDKTFLPVNLIHWEDDIIIDGEQAKEKLIKELSSTKLPRCGWIPTSHTRTYKAFMTAWKNKSFLEYLANPTRVQTQQPGTSSDFTVTDSSKLPIDPHHSIFPFDNYELECTNWEDDIIWDSANMPSIPKPRVLTLDYEDDPRMFGMPEDALLDDSELGQQTSKSYGKEQGGIKKSKIILQQLFKRQRQEEEEHIETQIAQIADKDPFNLSNDDYYLPKNNTKSQRSLASTSIQHSLPAQNIHPTFFPYLANISQLRNFHRPRLPIKMLQSLHRNTPILSLTRHIRLTNQRRERHISVEGGGFDIFLMRELHDLSGRDGTLLLLEYIEQFPPLLNQPGMASKIRNYYKRKPTKEQEKNDFEFGETSFSHTSPFLGKLPSHGSLQAIENNMYRAPIFKHRAQGTDFLLIRNKNGLFLRQFPALFVVGQELPLCEVPSPNSKRAKEFSRDFMMSSIYRMFWESDENPRRVGMDELRQVFPNQEVHIRKNMKQCAELKRMGAGREFWELRKDFRLPSREEVANMVTPEIYCAQASMMAAEQRLRDAGYGEKYLHVPENADDSDDQQVVDDEIKCAPWNTTRAYISAIKGKSFLDQSGAADPTGRGLGFSFFRVSAKPPKVKEKEEVEKDAPKKLVTGTNADLRKLPLKEARQMCRDFGLTEEEINSLERWDVIDVIRTLSTQASQGRADSQVSRFARGNARITMADMQNKHKEYCQRIFEKQNRWLSNPEPETGEFGWEANEEQGPLGRRYAAVYSTTTTLSDAERRKLEFEREERERMNLQKMIQGEVTKTGSSVSAAAREAVVGKKEEREGAQDAFKVPNPQSPSAGTSLLANESGTRGKLKIYRTIRNMDGTESTRVETVTHPQLIEAYVRIRSTRDDSFIKVYAQMDERYKEEKRKERRRQQENARRAKKGEPRTGQQEKEPAAQNILEVMKIAKQQQPSAMAAAAAPSKPSPKPKKEKVQVEKKPEKEKPPPPPPKPAKELKITCSACGGIGHMKTNRNCPLYGKEEDLATKTVGELCQPTTSKLSDIPDEEGDRLPSGELIEVEGTRLKISKKLYKHAEKERKNALRLHIPRKILEGGAKKPGKKPKGPPTKRPDVGAEMTREEVAASSLPPPPSSASAPLPIKAEESQPQTAGPSKQRALTINISVPPSVSAAQIGPLSAISSASSTGAGPLSAGNLKRRGTLEEADYLVGPHKSVHRRRADPRVSMASLLMEIVNELKGLEGSEHFTIPVNTKKVPDYLAVIKKPMDLQHIRKNISENKYELRRQFLSDLTQILVNSSTYNGPTHPITEAARKMIQHVTKKLEENEQKLIELEKQINPLLDDDDMVGLSYILNQIVQECKNLPKSAAFHSRVDPKKFPHYNDKIQRPMDLGTLEQNIKDHRYTTVASFKRDVEQILANSQIFNGPQSAYTMKAHEIVQLTGQLLDRQQGTLAELEANIQRALNANDDGTASSVAGDDRASLASWVSCEFATAERPIVADVGPQGDEAVMEVEAALGEGEEMAETVASSSPPTTDAGLPPDIKFYVGDDEEVSADGTRDEEGAGGILQEDLALSNEEEEGEEETVLGGELDEEEGKKEWHKQTVSDELLQSGMHTSGQLNADLALSESDEDEDEVLMSAKRPRLDDNLQSSL